MEAGGSNPNPAQEQKARTFMAYTDRELLARLVQCEAGGEGENGMRAVASVVMNRVNAVGGEYARIGRGNLRNIIFQPGQFVCASETRGLQSPEHLQYEPHFRTLRYRGLGLGRQPSARPGAGSLVLQSFQPHLPRPVSLECRVLTDTHRRPLLLQPHRRVLSNLMIGADRQHERNTEQQVSYAGSLCAGRE